MEFLSRTWTNFGWSLEKKKKKLTWNFLLVMRSVGTKFWDVVKFLLGMGFFFFFFLGVFWNEYFVSILMIGNFVLQNLKSRGSL